MSLLSHVWNRLSSSAALSAAEREDHWYGLRMAAIMQVAVANSNTEPEFEKCFLQIVGAFTHLKRERARSWLHNFLLPYLSAGEFTPRPRTLALRFLKYAPRRYRVNPAFFAQYLADYAATSAENQARLVRLCEEYDIEIKWRDPLAGVQAADRFRLEEPDRIQFAFFVPLLASQLSLYPADLVALAQVWRIILCDSLHFDGKPYRGLAVYDHNALFLNMAGGYVRESSCTLIHHELFHLLDRFALAASDEDEEWARLNPPGFQYARADERDQDKRAITGAAPGFMTAYAATNAREDKAELFGHLVVNYAVVSEKAAEDKVLAAKVDLMKRRLESICPEINADFWEGRRQADFWASCKAGTPPPKAPAIRV